MNFAMHAQLRSLMKSVLCVGVAASSSAFAADWSDTSISWRYGTSFRGPYVNQAAGSAQVIKKNILNFSHTSGYKYGIIWFSVDLLMSNSNDPSNCPNFQCTGSAQEAYVLYRNHIEWSKVFSDRAFDLPGIKV